MPILKRVGIFLSQHLFPDFTSQASHTASAVLMATFTDAKNNTMKTFLLKIP